MAVGHNIAICVMLAIQQLFKPLFFRPDIEIRRLFIAIPLHIRSCENNRILLTDNTLYAHFITGKNFPSFHSFCGKGENSLRQRFLCGILLCTAHNLRI